QDTRRSRLRGRLLRLRRRKPVKLRDKRYSGNESHDDDHQDDNLGNGFHDRRVSLEVKGPRCAARLAGTRLLAGPDVQERASIVTALEGGSRSPQAQLNPQPGGGFIIFIRYGQLDVLSPTHCSFAPLA